MLWRKILVTRSTKCKDQPIQFPADLEITKELIALAFNSFVQGDVCYTWFTQFLYP